MSDPTESIPDYVPVNANNKMEVEEANKDNYVGTISFSQMNLKKEVMQAITDCGFEHPSEVQSQVIPKALIQQDILCQAKSGMGKTAVFVITILNQDYCNEDYTSALVVCHTREMVLQVQKEFKRMKKRLDEAHEKKIRVGAFVGGYGEQQDIDQIKRKMPNIVIGTPGRLLSLVNKGTLKLDKLKTFVIDECDKVLAANTFMDVSAIFMQTPKDKQTMLFSATISDENKATCRKILKNPFEVFIDDGEKLFLHGLHLFYKKVDDRKKSSLLSDIISDIDFNKAMIFVDGKQRCQAVSRKLTNLGFPVGVIHGKMEQRRREEEYSKFKKGDTRILVSTDLCGRGIDIAEVNLVVNFDMPRESDQFLHRVGRAGRFGTKGIAISFVDNEEDDKIFAEVKKRFVVEMDELPENMKEIPTSLYK